MLNFWGVKLVGSMRFLVGWDLFFVGMLCLYNFDLAAHRKGYRVNQPFTWENGWVGPFVTLSTGVAEVCKVVSFNLFFFQIKEGEQS